MLPRFSAADYRRRQGVIGNGQGDAHTRALPGLGLKGQPSAMFVHQGRRNGQAQPGATFGGFGGKKGITQAGEMLGRNAHALIRDFQHQAALLGPQARRHAHLTPRVWQGFQGIHNEIDHHVLKVLDIAPHWR
jgi:hypothetical protein